MISRFTTEVQRERNIKHWPRLWKLRIIAAQNPNWDDLNGQLTWLTDGGDKPP